MSDDSSRLLQLQSDKLVVNWRQTASDSAYPNYPSLQADFEHAWTALGDLLLAEGMPVISVQQCEVTYVNHIETDQSATAFRDLAAITPLWSGKSSDDQLPAPDSGRFAVRFPIEPASYLHVELEHAVRTTDAHEVQLTLSARRRVPQPTPDPILYHLDQAHDCVVRAFASVTTSAMHKRWGRER